MDLFDLTGHVSVVTGGNRGIGLGLARGLAKAGASVALDLDAGVQTGMAGLLTGYAALRAARLFFRTVSSLR